MKLAFYWAIALFCSSAGNVIAQTVSGNLKPATPDFKAYESLHIPDLRKAALKGVILVAVIDDAFNLNHRSLKNYIYKSTREIPGNGIDDDGNGYADDISGWDAADNDWDVSVPQGRGDFFYHGTMIAGSIAMVAERCFGTQAAEHLKLLPVIMYGQHLRAPLSLPDREPLKPPCFGPQAPAA